MGKLIDLTGLKYNNLTVVSFNCIKNHRSYWNCLCDCGNSVVVWSADLKRNHTTSCGCIHTKAIQTHNKTNTKIYKVWIAMKHRCYNSNNKYYKDYGDRGITICEEWLNDFINFYNWSIDNGYKDGLTIDRIDVNGNYEPSNCRWSNMLVQSNNTRKNRLYTINNETKSVSELSRIYNINKSTVFSRLRKNWSIEKALTTPTK